MRAADIAKGLKGHRFGRRWRARCPAHGGTSDTSLSIADGDNGKVLLTCFAGCSFEDIRDELQRLNIWPEVDSNPPSGGRARLTPRPAAPEPDPERHETLSDRGRGLWASTLTVTAESLAGRYLLGRACALPHPGSDLRWLPAVKHPPSGETFPCLMGLVTDTETGVPLSLHRTWLAADGSGKAPVERPRLYLAHHRKDGVVRLWPDEEVTGGLAIAEGLETALSAARGFTPVWSVLDAGNLAAFPVLDGIEALTVIGDHDLPNKRTGRRAGNEAAEACARRWHEAGREVRIWLSEREAADFNDFAAEVA